MYSKSINNLIASLKKLPSVGQRTAERFVFYWLKSGKKEVNELADALNALLANTRSCEICWNFDDENPCSHCRDKRRDGSVVCVVENPQDRVALEKTGEYHGLYHILRGVIDIGSPAEDMQKLKIKELFVRLKTGGVKEAILAFNHDLPGETTMLYLEKEIKKLFPKIKITRLARGLPMGSDLEYADEITLSSALKNRTQR